MSTVLITGGAGFISSNFVRHLLRATPYEVVSLDALTYAGNIDNLAEVMSHPRLSFVHGDIRDTELVRISRDEMLRLLHDSASFAVALTRAIGLRPPARARSRPLPVEPVQRHIATCLAALDGIAPPFARAAGASP